MRIDTRSLRFRFLLASLLWVSIATTIAGFVISSLYRTHVTEQYREEIEVHLIELVGLADTSPRGGPILDRPLSDPRFVETSSGFYWQIVRDGRILARSRSMPRGTLSGRFAGSGRQATGRTPGPNGIDVLETGIAIRARDGGRPLQFSMGAEWRLIDATLDRFNRDLALSLMVFAILLVIGAMLQVAYGLRPVNQLGNDIDRLRRGAIDRLPSNIPSEFAPLVDRLNALLDTQTALVKRARVEAGNLAHGLRTPLALIADEADRLTRTGQADAAEFVLGQSDRMRRQIDYHMARASAAGSRASGRVTTVRPVVRQIIDAMRRLHPERTLTFEIDVPSALEVDCDEGDLGEMLSNLIDNACKWARGTITVTASMANHGIDIAVTDDGPGIDPSQRDAVFDVGMRLDEAKPGVGLGLAISRDLARLYGGDLRLADGKQGGLAAIVSLPDG